MNNWQELIDVAERVSASAYAPYSGFQVGAALECKDGTIFDGTNVENSSYGLSVCAERAALAAAVARGHRAFRRLVIRTETDAPVAPCGACRQMLAEFAPDLPVLSVYDGGTREWTLEELLPAPFHLRELESRSGSDRA